MMMLIFKCWLRLLQIDVMMRIGTFKQLQDHVKASKLKGRRQGINCDTLCDASRLACAFYFKRVLCLQRSAMTALMLRSHGYDAVMVIGVRMIPARFHAWLEVDSRVVADKPYTAQMYKRLSGI